MYSRPARSGWGRLLASLSAVLMLTGACGVRTHDASDTAAPAAGSSGAESPQAGSGSAPTPDLAPTESSSGAGSVSGSGRIAPAPAPGSAGAAPGSVGAAAPAPKPSSAGAAPGASSTGARNPTPLREGASAGPAPGQAAGSPAAPSPAPGAPTQSPAAGCTGQKAPIVIGSVSTMSGVAGEAMKGGPLAVQTWVAAVNSKGGVNCHPVKYTIADDGADPNRHRALIQQMVESNKVVAFVHNGAVLSGYSSVDYINQKQVPVIGNEGGSTWFYDSPYFFPQGVSGGEPFNQGFFASLALSGAAAGKTKVAVLACIEVPVCSAVKSKAEEETKKFGLELVYNAEASLTQPDFTSHCLRAQSAGAQMFVLSLDGASLHRIAASCDAVGFHPIYNTVTAAIRTDFAQNPQFEGFIGAVWTRPWFDTSNPMIQEFQAALKRFGGGLTPGPAEAGGWASAKVFEYAARALGDTPTPAGVLEGLWSIKNNDFGGLTAPLTFTKGEKAKPVLCFWAPVIKSGKWTGGDKRICP